MAMHIAGRRSENGRRRGYRPMSEINVTPFVDVMLVLLVIFMVTAPLLTVAVPVDLPKAKAAAVGKPEKPLIISLQADGRIYLQETALNTKTLIARLKAIAKARNNPRIFVRGDKTVPYGRVMQVMSSISSAGFPEVALVAEDGD
ncbi:MAG: protein TolR [Rhodospirillaceae bacterium]|nr:protein TolR [Rhodospirillaceae bacterium]